MINSRMLKLKSEELNIAFANLLAGNTVELVVLGISREASLENLWLCNGDDLGIDVYRKKAITDLKYIYGGNQDLKEIVQETIKSLDSVFIENNYTILSCKFAEKTNMAGYDIHLELNLDDKFIPIDIEIEKAKEEYILPYTRNLKLIGENNKTIDYLHYPSEEALCSHMVEILKQLELINEMEHYYAAYKIIKTYSMEGRKFREKLKDACSERHIKLEAKTYNTLKGYGDYKYMEKKWKNFLKKEKLTEPSWQELLEKINDFTEPIWESIVEDRIFFGDWMPELGRYLD
ncbi:MAG: hypothetical protein K6B67_04335 [Lachnospiraceae bacterium]|nr:hypothetical protein [Lachnospiraceae bacterium]